MEYTIRVKCQENKHAKAFWQDFSYTGSADNSVAAVLNELNARNPFTDKNGNLASPIAWECSCMIRKCGACAMRINGIPRLACSFFLRSLKTNLVLLEPLSKFPLVKDLVVDRSMISEQLKQAKLWLESDANMSSYTHEQRYQSAKCLLCGCCLEVCPNYSAENTFAGAILPVNAYRLLEEEQNQTHRDSIAANYRKAYFEGCGQSLACQNICPAHIPVAELLARSNAMAVWKR